MQGSGGLSATMAIRADRRAWTQDGELLGSKTRGLENTRIQPVCRALDVIEDRVHRRDEHQRQEGGGNQAADQQDRRRLSSSDPSSMPRASGVSATTTEIWAACPCRRRIFCSNSARPHDVPARARPAARLRPLQPHRPHRPGGSTRARRAAVAPGDRRVKSLVATPKGEALRGQLATRLYQAPEYLARLPAEDQAKLREVLLKLVDDRP